MIEVGSKRQLFLDDYIIGRMDNVSRVLHQPEKRLYPGFSTVKL